jgi:hypothetical protein
VMRLLGGAEKRRADTSNSRRRTVLGVCYGVLFSDYFTEATKAFKTLSLCGWPVQGIRKSSLSHSR